ncbi:protein trichome birefringence-like 6, partial [Phalaenopsis equestris]|uniref:protein trichome birefringence-like 6 n=1 Tax=Phalaenopsis equestris TaxID=78828 RepID=UPI0009E203CE
KSSFKTARILFISFTIPFSLFLSFWAISICLSISSQTQLPLSFRLKKTSKADDHLNSVANLSVPEPKYAIPKQPDEVGIAEPPGKAFDSNGRGSVQNGISGALHLDRSTILSTEGLDLVGAGKNVDGRGTVSTTDGIVSITPSSVAVISSFSSSISNGSSGNVYEKGSASVRAEISAEPCDVLDGRWLYDESYPLYSSNACPYIDEGFSCEANGRTDTGYMKWRWQPNSCNIPRFNPVKFLKLIRGKRLVFVGDSINRNQWESMLCLLRGAVLDPSRVYEARGRKITKENGVYNFKFMDYRCSVEYYVTHFLVHESKARVGQKRVNTLRIDTMDRSSSRWRGADIMVFNTAHWWSHHKTKAGVNYYQEGGKVHAHLDVSTAFRKALTTWASWIDRNISGNKTQVFFRSSAPKHFSGGEWSSGGHCKENTKPLNYSILPSTPEMNLIVDQVIKQMRTPVTVLNVTSLSGLRIDGHPSIYGRRPGSWPSSNVQDCSHWCLPGVPDTWNELLYFYLQTRRSSTET